MNQAGALVALLTLVPAMAGPLPAAGAARIAAALCGGGTVSIPLSAPQLPGGPESPCCAKGCHSGQSRKRLDGSQ